MIQASITTKFKANIMASASAQLSSNGGNDDEASCWLSSGDATGSDISQHVTSGIADVANHKQTIAVDGATVKNAGSYTIKLFCAVNAGTVTFDQGNLNVWAIASP